jgi:hypothetical protein
MISGPEQDQQGIDDDECDRDQQDELAVLGPIDERVDDAGLQRIAEHEQNAGERDNHRQRVEPERGERYDGEVHRDRHHLAVGKIDDAHDAKNDREAERHQAIDEAGQKTAHRDVEIDLCRHRSVLPPRRLRPSIAREDGTSKAPVAGYGKAPAGAAAGAGSACDSLSRAGHRGSSAIRAWRSRQPWARR